MEVASTDSSLGMTTANAGATRWMAPELFHSEQSEYPPSCPSPRPEQASDRSNTSAKKRGSEEVSIAIRFDLIFKSGQSHSEDHYEGVTPRSDVWGMLHYHCILRSSHSPSIWDDRIRINDRKSSVPTHQT
jgi:hypothetical protein